MQTCYAAVRQLAPSNLVLVDTPNWSQLVGTAAASPSAGTNVVYVAHMYPRHWVNGSVRAQIRSCLDRLPVRVRAQRLDHPSHARGLDHPPGAHQVERGVGRRRSQRHGELPQVAKA